MKLFSRTTTAILIGALLAVQACKKDDTPVDPSGPQTPDTVLTEQKLIGTWEAISYSAEVHDSTDKVISSEKKIKDKGYYVNGQGPQGRYWQTSDISYISFSADHTFRHFDINGNGGSYMFDRSLPKTGAWGQTAHDVLRLSTLYGNRSIDTSWYCLYVNGEVGITLGTTDTSALNPARNYLLETIVLHRKEK